MLRNAVLGASVAACFTALTACAANHYVQRGTDLYSEGRYVEADEVFEHSEPSVARATLEERAAYAAYRGATFVALGDLLHARRWLSVASELERTHPGTLGGADKALLEGAWRALTNGLQATPPPATTAIASSSQPPSPSVEAVPPSLPVQQRALVPQ